MICRALFVDQYEPINALIFGEGSSEVLPTRSDKDKLYSCLLKLRLVWDQVSDLLTTEQSAIVAKEDQHSGGFRPQITQPNGRAVGCGEGHRTQLVRSGHGQAVSHSHAHACRLFDVADGSKPFELLVREVSATLAVGHWVIRAQRLEGLHQAQRHIRVCL